MTPSNIESGYWVSTPERFIACYATRKEAQDYIDFQINVMKSKNQWFIDHIKITFVKD